MVRTLKILVASLTAVCIAGCGGSDDRDEATPVSSDQRGVLSTIDALQAASRRGDAAEICNAIFTEGLAKSIGRASKRSCEKEVRATLASPDAQLSVGRSIDVRGTRATATVREQNGDISTIVLVKEGDRWRIDGIRPAEP